MPRKLERVVEQFYEVYDMSDTNDIASLYLLRRAVNNCFSVMRAPAPEGSQYFQFRDFNERDYLTYPGSEPFYESVDPLIYTIEIPFGRVDIIVERDCSLAFIYYEDTLVDVYEHTRNAAFHLTEPFNSSDLSTWTRRMPPMGAR